MQGRVRVMIQKIKSWWKKESKSSKILSTIAVMLFVFSIVIGSILGISFAASTSLPEKLLTNTLYSDDGYRVNLFPELSGDDIISLTPFVATEGDTTYHMYCLERTKDWYNDTTIVKAEKLDAGYAYIMMNGYPEKKLSNEGDWVDSYLTQVAIWLYQDRSAGVSDDVSGSLTANQKKAIISSKYYSIINDLVTNALKQKEIYENIKPQFSISSSDFHLDSTFSYLETDFISVTSNIYYSSYKVALSMADAQLINKSGNVVQAGDSIAAGEPFKIRIPLDKLSSDKLSLQVDVIMDYQEYEAYQYRPTSHQDAMQLSIAAAVEATSKQASASTNLILPTGSLRIEKIAGNTNQLLAGAKIEVYREIGSDRKLVHSFDSTTEATTLTDLIPGKYTVVEKSAPSGYLVQSDSQSIILDTDDLNADLRLVNTPVTVQIRKVDSDTNESLAGAVIKVIDESGKEVYRFTSTDGYVTIPNLSVGKYQAIEVQAPDGYYLNTEPYDFSITEETTELSITMKDMKNQVEILKVDEESGDVLSGAVLRLVNTDTKEEIASWLTTDEAKIFTGLPAGNYQVEEVSAPEGYVQQTNTMPFTISNTQSKKVTIKFSNTKSEVMISKIDEAGKLLAGAKIVIYNEDGNKVKEFVSKSTPIVIEKLAVGHYTAKEVEAPAGYQLNPNPVSFEIKKDTKNLSVALKNTKKALYFGKIDADTGNYISGAELQLVDSDGDVVEKWISSNDLYMISGLDNGTYYLEEVSAPAGYVTSSERVKVVVNDNTTVSTYTLKNKKISVKIAKVDADTKEFVSGATLELLNSNYEVVDTWTTGNDYQVFNDLDEGIYYIKEVSAPAGYVINDSLESFTIDEENPNVEVSFKNKKTVVKLGKVDVSTGKYIAGATLKLSRVDGGMEDITFISEDKATVFRGLAAGSYILEEISAPAGYVGNDSNITFDIDAAGNTKNVALKSEFISISVQNKQLHIDTNGVSGYEFQLLSTDNQLIDTYKVSKNEFVSDTLTDGTYLLIQSKVPDGMILNSNPYTFTISDSNINDVILFTNDYTKVQFDKKAMVGGEQLAGGHFILRDAKGDVVEEWDSTSTSKVINRLNPGTYTLSEVKAPNGYQLSSAPLTFKVFETSDVQVVSMFNAMEVEVPNTSKNTLLFWFIGFLLLFSGLSIFSYTYLKRQG